MIWNIIQVLAAFCTLFKGMKQYKQASKIYETLKRQQLVNVSQLDQLWKNINKGKKIITDKIFVIIKGIAKAKQNQQDKNILSIIHKKNLSLKPLVMNVIHKVHWSKIPQDKKNRRPSNFKYIDFYLKDINSDNKIRIQDCSSTNLSGALNQVFTDQIVYPQPKNTLLRIFNYFYNNLSKIFPFSSFIKPKYGEQNTLYQIKDGQYLLAIGEITKNPQNNQFIMRSPKFLTKQKSFIINRYKKIMDYLYWPLLIILIIKIYALYQIGKKLIKSQYFKNFFNINSKNNQNEEDRSQNQGQMVNCIICYTNIRTVILKPCKHYGYCMECYEAFKQKGCPLCKVQIEGIIQVVKQK